jgi:hypothetical protein
MHLSESRHRSLCMPLPCMHGGGTFQKPTPPAPH